MNKSGLKTLLGDLKDVKVGTRELSDGCLEATGWEGKRVVSFIHRDTTTGTRIWCPPGTPRMPKFYYDGTQPDPTRDTQDALDWMVPERIEVFIHLASPKEAIVQFGVPRHMPFGEAEVEGDNALSRAFCMARIKLELDKPDE